MLSVPFERDFQQIAKINSQQEKPVFPNYLSYYRKLTLVSIKVFEINVT